MQACTCSQSWPGQIVAILESVWWSYLWPTIPIHPIHPVVLPPSSKRLRVHSFIIKHIYFTITQWGNLSWEIVTGLGSLNELQSWNLNPDLAITATLMIRATMKPRISTTQNYSTTSEKTLQASTDPIWDMSTNVLHPNTTSDGRHLMSDEGIWWRHLMSDEGTKSECLISANHMEMVLFFILTISSGPTPVQRR